MTNEDEHIKKIKELLHLKIKCNNCDTYELDSKMNRGYCSYACIRMLLIKEALQQERANETNPDYKKPVLVYE